MANGKIRIAITAGATGGLAEVLWITATANALGTDSWNVARAVGLTLVPDLAGSSVIPWVGLVIHFLLSFVLATLFVQVIGRLRPVMLFLAALTTLAAVWAFNFLVLLPLINPGFVTLLPHPVTLISKLLFGVAMATVLVRGNLLNPSEGLLEK